MKTIKRVRKTFNKAAKAVGFNAMERRRIKKVAGNIAYDTAVNVCSSLCLDAVYTAADAAVCGVCMAKSAVKKGIGALMDKKATSQKTITTVETETTVEETDKENVG